MHNVADAGERGAKCPAGVKGLEIGGGKAARFQKGDGKGIAEGHHQGGRRSRRPGFATGFRGWRDGEQEITGPAKRTVRLRGHRDQGHAEPAAIGDQVAKLAGFARLGQCQHGIAAGNHTEIAVARLGRVDVIGGRPC